MYIKCLKLVLKHILKTVLIIDKEHNRYNRHNIIDKEKVLWLRNKVTGEKLGAANIYDLIDIEIKDRFGTKDPTNEQIREYKRHGPKLVDAEKCMYTCEGIIMNTMMHCRVLTLKAIEFTSKLWINQHDIILTIEQSVIKLIYIFRSIN